MEIMAEVGKCDGCAASNVDRRTFVSQAALAAAALVLAACGDGDGFVAGPGPLNASIKVGDFPELANVDGAVAIVLNNRPVAIVRPGATTFLALSRVCPHQGGVIVSNNAGAWFCTGHGAQFSLRGDWTGGEQTWDMARWATSYNTTTDILTIS
jgi:Rieske Fe-S protein